MRRAVLRLERRVRDERIVVRRLDDLRRAGERLLGVAVDAQRERRLLRRELLRLARKPFAALLRGRRLRSTCTCSFSRAVFACHQLSATIATPASGREVSVVPSTTNACRTPGIALISSRFALHDLAAEDRALLVHGPQHPGQREVDAERRLAGDDARVVDAARGLCR